MNHRLLVSVCGDRGRAASLVDAVDAHAGRRPRPPAAAAERRNTRCRARRTASPICRASGPTPRIRPWSGRRTSTKEFYTQEEALEQVKRLAAAESEQTEPGTIADVHYDFTQFGLDRSQGGWRLNLRTSLIVDPPDGRLPPMTAEGQKRTAARAEARKRMGAATDAVQNQSLSVRCILMDRTGPPMLPGAYNNNYQIVQTPGYVMILVEMIHDVAHHPARRASASAAKRPPVDGKLPRPLGGRHAGRRDHEFHRQDGVPRIQREHALDRALHTRGRGHDPSINSRSTIRPRGPDPGPRSCRCRRR